ncbi:hypothetical protein KDW_57980 [Dictyobacter vulcani]|uniref:Uncharacterized protein n=1 Tax=Dictyobacter vulcani TaxID=2607529 RepID=A0A5J4L2F2_9CHLR|nr:ABC transporter permease subunit [Dictyobacter vulcani]GER91636.1 hypothetical protein KDW_57980 [Dictyobacter vulcani]
MIIITGIVFAQEYSWGTLRLWLSKGIARTQLFVAKGVLAIFTVLLIVGVCLLSVALLSLFFSIQLQHKVHLEQLDVLQLLLAYLRTIYALLPYAALTLLLVVLTRSGIIAVGGAIAFSTIFEGLLKSLAPRLGSGFMHIVFYLPSGLASTLSSQNFALAICRPRQAHTSPHRRSPCLGSRSTHSSSSPWPSGSSASKIWPRCRPDYSAGDEDIAAGRVVSLEASGKVRVTVGIEGVFEGVLCCIA